MIKKLRIFDRGCQISKDFKEVVPNILQSSGSSIFHGVLDFQGCQISCDRIFGRGCQIFYSLMGVPVSRDGEDGVVWHPKQNCHEAYVMVGLRDWITKFKNNYGVWPKLPNIIPVKFSHYIVYWFESKVENRLSLKYSRIRSVSEPIVDSYPRSIKGHLTN